MRPVTLALIVFTTAGFVYSSQQLAKKIQKIGAYAIENVSPKRSDKVVRTPTQWKKLLTADQYDILRESGTERAFSGSLLHITKPGTFVCAGCGLPLFATNAKFESGTGWPSFFQPITRKNIWLKGDSTFGMDRVEVLCARCDGHLGHVFDDGPADKTGLRFCINSPALKFIALKK